MAKKYWWCMIGPVEKDQLPDGADGILRYPVREAFNEAFGPDEICASSWNMDQERFDLYRQINLIETAALKQMLSK